MKAPKEVEDLLVDSIRRLEREIIERKDTIKVHGELVEESKKSLKKILAKKKELDRFAKKFGIVVAPFVPLAPWNGSLPESLTNTGRNAELAGILANLDGNGELDV